jgi:5'(3')-deoxyribonucleotidase
MSINNNMRIVEVTSTGIPHLYLDMDGVQADFFTAWANLNGVNRYKEIGDREAREQSITDLTSRGPEFIENFFANLEVLPNFHVLLDYLQTRKIPYTILSAPLRDNHEASIKGKKRWLDKHHPGVSNNAIFRGDKERYAVTNGRPNVLVDDHKKYITRWEEKGGIGVLHRDNNPQLTIDKLEEIYSQYFDK